MFADLLKGILTSQQQDGGARHHGQERRLRPQVHLAVSPGDTVRCATAAEGNRAHGELRVVYAQDITDDITKASFDSREFIAVV